MWSEQGKLAEDNEAMYQRWIARSKGDYLQFIRFEAHAIQ
jgi:hypothetical protein